jgi:4-hydroxy-L-threonine phosphate dehydrogenase PdxA
VDGLRPKKNGNPQSNIPGLGPARPPKAASVALVNDLVVAMYHDQGHIPMKLMKNRAAARNIKAALKLAVSMAQRGIQGYSSGRLYLP